MDDTKTGATVAF